MMNIEQLRELLLREVCDERQDKRVRVAAGGALVLVHLVENAASGITSQPEAPTRWKCDYCKNMNTGLHCINCGRLCDPGDF